MIDTINQDACTAYIERLSTQEYVTALHLGHIQADDTRPPFISELLPLIQMAEKKAQKTGNSASVQDLINEWKKSSAAFAALFKDKKTTHIKKKTAQVEDTTGMPPLPMNAQLSPDRSYGACTWVDNYIAFSKHWSPRSFDDFHEACAWAMLSTIAKRRVVLHLGSPKYTPLLLAIIADSSLSAKTEAAKVFNSVLRKAGLWWMMGPDNMTPQAMIESMSKSPVPNNYAELSEEEQTIIKRTLAYKGQMGWFYEEFGEQMDAMMQKGGGVMSDFKSIIRRMDDCYPEYVRDTIKHGKQHIEFPYLALLGIMTPLDLRPYAEIDSPLWRNGFLARFILIVPEKTESKRDPFPIGDMYQDIPYSLTSPLQAWNERLKQRSVVITPAEDEKHAPTIDYGDFPESLCTLGTGVIDAFYTYNNALLDITEKYKLEHFAGNYARLHMLALRIAMLAASLENNGHIEMRHWAKGQEFAEKGRKGLHVLWNRLQENSYAQEQTRIEDEIIQYLANSPTYLTSRVMRRRKFKNYTSEVFDPKLDNLVSSGELIKKQDGKTKYYTSQGGEDKPLPSRTVTEENE